VYPRQAASAPALSASASARLWARLRRRCRLHGGSTNACHAATAR
jgi:hypothetical protein